MIHVLELDLNPNLNISEMSGIKFDKGEGDVIKISKLIF